ncbi:TORTIFOLIA1-like protein 3 [Camellia lanceoleosa]|uniref:TORTIFOLIA1-like protein 3 n=1 Tax=Camellia lanceoleosa TaxID=1840588 RepID=A0ACC0FAJ7_9ERIC|nr:TORTIFOLIA1-like protein 3 [Camellia lanceoleosa]
MWHPNMSTASLKVQGHPWPLNFAGGDHNSFVCFTATAFISSHLIKPPFTSIIKPFVESLFTEQDHNSQIRAALCLTAAINATSDSDGDEESKRVMVVKLRADEEGF